LTDPVLDKRYSLAFLQLPVEQWGDNLGSILGSIKTVSPKAAEVGLVGPQVAQGPLITPQAVLARNLPILPKNVRLLFIDFCLFKKYLKNRHFEKEILLSSNTIRLHYSG
jgi:hypothetical protein